MSFVAWMRAVAQVLPAHVIAIDGKTMHGARDRGSSKAAIYVVSAWASANRLILTRVKFDDQSNEIAAIPDPLRTLAIEGCIVTTDAMGCQREIAQQIIDQGGDYVLALKENQTTLYHDVVEMFAHAHSISSGTSVSVSPLAVQFRRFALTR